VQADALLLNAHILTGDRRHPTADAVAMRGSYILAVGCGEDLRELRGPNTEILDAEGGLAVPAFHDAHCHLLAWARFHNGLDCREIASIEELIARLESRTAALQPAEWLRGNGYDDTLLGRHPDCQDLDAAAPDHPVRLQHRSLHLDVLNTRALQLAGLMGSGDRRIERKAGSDEPTGRLFNGGDLLRDRTPRPSYAALACDVSRASEQLLGWGVTTVQDASFTNGEEEWELFHRLAHDGRLRVRTCMMVGSPRWRQANDWRPDSSLVRRGPVKLMLDESTTDAAEFRAELWAARRAGQAVAVHATSEAEVAMALDAFGSAPRGPLPTPNRLEHASVVPDALLEEVRDLGMVVVGQPSLVYNRGDVYRDEYAPEQHAWLHRGRSWLSAGVPYAIGSDAPVTEPNPLLALAATRYRSTRGGGILGPNERLTKLEALHAVTSGPAAAVGLSRHLGRISPGMLADIVLLDADTIDVEAADLRPQMVRATIMTGRVVYRRNIDVRV
jgi:predicted amidohydrolase YtcJ